ncbi:MAG TPA: orotidine-5'-phosphate decarboxylase [Caulobacteraceae bacterium]|nr:orotidine-5'-phosphate decarboxylase [Caulobacteraceae bacterium]
MALAAAARAETGAADPRLIVPLDLPTRAQAEAMIERLGDAVSFYKIGLELLATEGAALGRDLRRRGRQVFADWKLHDIGATVERAVAAIAASEACDVVNVHAEPQVLAAAMRGRGSSPMKLLGVTVLTSLSGQDLGEIGYAFTPAQLVERRIRQCLDAGLDGVVASPLEARLARQIGGPDFLVMTPGVRPTWASLDDQRRAETPAFALAEGASHIICGRPITAAADPRAAALAVVEEIAGV